MNSSADELLLRGPNPFSSNVFSDAWHEPRSDAASVNRKAFESLLVSLDEVRTSGTAASVLLHGAPGTGKTHLLGRLRRSLNEGDGAKAVFVYVRLTTNPEGLWRHVRRVLVDNLLRTTPLGLSQLQLIFAHRFAEEHEQTTRVWIQKVRVIAEMDDPVMTAWFERSMSSLDLPADIRKVLESLLFGKFVMDARDWLNGEYLTDQALARLGLDPNRYQVDDEFSAKEVVFSLAKLAPRSLPVVICLDQIEAVERFNGDEAAVFKVGRVGADLRDGDRSLLLVSCIQSSFLSRLETETGGADHSRLSEREALLLPISYDEARTLLISRLEAQREASGIEAEVGRDPLWPLDAGELKQFIESEEQTPRTLLSWAQKAFDVRSGGTPTRTRPITEVLEGLFDEMVDKGCDALGPTEQHIAHGILLASPAFEDLQVEEVTETRDVVLRVSRSGQRTHVGLLNQPRTQTLHHPLGRLEALVERNPEVTPMILIRDARRAIGAGAKKTRERLARLEQKGVHLVSVHPDALAALGAARMLISDAPSGV